MFLGYGRVLKIKNNATILRGRRGVGRGEGQKTFEVFFFSNTIYNMIARVLFLFLMEKDITSINHY